MVLAAFVIALGVFKPADPVPPSDKMQVSAHAGEVIVLTPPTGAPPTGEVTLVQPLIGMIAYAKVDGTKAQVPYFLVDARDGEDGLLMAPAHAVPRMLERAGLGMADFDLIEVHEAFASQVLATLAAWEKRGLAPVDRARLNVAGSSLATGHPFAATGGRIIATTAKYLKTTGKKRSLVSICAAGGQGLTAIVEAA